MLGHVAALRISETVWAGIDNVSAHVTGSWLQDYTIDWLRVCKALMDTEVNLYMHWIVSKGAGIWKKIEAEMEADSIFLFAKHRGWSTNPFVAPVGQALELNEYDFSLITFDDLVQKGFFARSYGKEYLHQVSRGTTGSCDSVFQNDFISDYGRPLKRYYAIVSKNNVPVFILTFTDFPFWPSINRSYDHAIFFDLGVLKKITVSDEIEIVNKLRTIVTINGGVPVSYIVFSSTLRTSVGEEISSLLLTSAGIQMCIDDKASDAK